MIELLVLRRFNCCFK